MAGPVTVSVGRTAPAGAGNGHTGLATTVVRALDAADVTVEDVQVSPPSLDDVFFALTGAER